MSTFIESLESRELFSISVPVALATFHSDVASIGNEIKIINQTNAQALHLLHGEVSLFTSTASTDTAALEQVNANFATNFGTLKTDFSYAKALYGQDVNRLVALTVVSDRHPKNTVLAARVTNAQNLLQAQGIRALTVLSDDADTLILNYDAAVAAVAAGHPIDATLATSAGDIEAAFHQDVDSAVSKASIISSTDIPDLITSLDPGGSANTY